MPGTSVTSPQSHRRDSELRRARGRAPHRGETDDLAERDGRIENGNTPAAKYFALGFSPFEPWISRFAP